MWSCAEKVAVVKLKRTMLWGSGEPGEDACVWSGTCWNVCKAGAVRGEVGATVEVEVGGFC